MTTPNSQLSQGTLQEQGGWFVEDLDPPWQRWHHVGGRKSLQGHPQMPK